MVNNDNRSDSGQQLQFELHAVPRSRLSNAFASAHESKLYLGIFDATDGILCEFEHNALLENLGAEKHVLSGNKYLS